MCRTAKRFLFIDPCLKCQVGVDKGIVMEQKWHHLSESLRLPSTHYLIPNKAGAVICLSEPRIGERDVQTKAQALNML